MPERLPQIDWPETKNTSSSRSFPDDTKILKYWFAGSITAAVVFAGVGYQYRETLGGLIDSRIETVTHILERSKQDQIMDIRVPFKTHIAPITIEGKDTLRIRRAPKIDGTNLVDRFEFESLGINLSSENNYSMDVVVKKIIGDWYIAEKNQNEYQEIDPITNELKGKWLEFEATGRSGKTETFYVAEMYSNSKFVEIEVKDKVK